MKFLNLSVLLLGLALVACTTTTTKTEKVTFNDQGNPVHTQTTTTTKNDAVEGAKKVGKGVSNSVSKGYNWVKDKSVKAYEAVTE